VQRTVGMTLDPPVMNVPIAQVAWNWNHGS